MRSIHKIYIHCSATKYGTVESIRKSHLLKGFNDIGYHKIILNPFSNSKDYIKHFFNGDYIFTSITDGMVMDGRLIEIEGAHVEHDNEDSIGICYIGESPTVNQYMSLINLCYDYMKLYNISIENILGHHEYFLKRNIPIKKTCPNINMDVFRGFLSKLI